MVHLHRKKLKGKTYYYLREIAWVDGRPKVVRQRYVGTAAKIEELLENAEKAAVPARIKSFEYGRTAALLTVAEELGFVGAVNDNTAKKRTDGLTVGEYLLLILLGRCEGPKSKQEIGRWVAEDSFLHLAWSFPHKLNTQNFTNHMDYVLDPAQHERGEAGAIPAIEEAVGRNLVAKGITPATLVWDTTNMVTHVDEPGELVRKAKSKQGRTGKNLIGLGICVSGENVPLLHEVYPANMNDAKLFPRFIERIVERLERLNVDLAEQKVTLVFDKGNNSNDNIAAALEKMHVVGSLKKDQAKELVSVPLGEYEFLYENGEGHRIVGYRRDGVRLFGLDEPFTVVAAYNEATARRQAATYERSKKRILDGLAKLKEKAARADGRGRRMTEKGLHAAVNDLIEKDYRALYDYKVREVKAATASGREVTVLELTYQLDKGKEDERYLGFGKNILFTDDAALSSEQVARTYNSKAAIEDDMKWLKDKLLISVTPQFHSEEARIRVHVFICVMGLVFYRYLAWRLGRFGLTMKRLVDELERVRVAMTKHKGSNRLQLTFEEMTPLQAQLFSALDLGRHLKGAGGP